MGIGASAGGLEAATKLLHEIPANTGMAFVLVQHLDPDHESALAELLGRATALPVCEVTDGLRIQPNQVYVIPPAKRMSIEGGVLRLQARKPGRTPPRSIDFFLESLAQDRGDQAIGVILSGTATDGTLGLEAIKGEGGITFAQDASATHPSMPRSAVAAGCVDFELPPEKIAKELARIAAHPLLTAREPLASAENTALSEHQDDDTPLPSGGEEPPSRQPQPPPGRKGPAETETGDFRKVLLLLRNHAGVDFLLYKSATIRRRIVRRMVLSRIETVARYADFLRGNKRELDSLYADLLINVTSFFRNPEAFELLQRKVFEPLLAQRSSQPVRIWTLGCSTGQEAYSLAMAFAESAAGHARARKLQIFATDLNEALLEKARAGLYSSHLAQDISPERLRRFFVEETGGYRVAKELRQCVVFARQNVLNDPPFSRMDLVSCRNLMIYLEPDLQKKIVPMFHYALNPKGVLFLGASESISGFTDLFEPIDKKQKLFARKSGTPAVPRLPTNRPARSAKKRVLRPLPILPVAQGGLSLDLAAQREADRVTMGRFSPPSVLVNSALQILQFRGATNAYLAPSAGKANFDLLKMAAEGLIQPLRGAIAKARKEGKSVRREGVRVRQNGGSRTITLHVTPLNHLKERHFVIFFEEERSERGGGLPPGAAAALAESSERNGSRGNRALRDELAEVRDYLQSVQDQGEAANEELQAANEEVTSANEELQSVNEELETSKEELESSNEELTTINEEMAARNNELHRLNADLKNLQASIDTAILVVGRDLRIRHFTPAAEKFFNLQLADLGQQLGGILRGFRSQTETAPLEELVRRVIDGVSTREYEIRDHSGRWYSLRIRPYLTLDNKVDGAVLLFVDIDTLKRAEQEAVTERNYAEAVLGTAHDPLLVLRSDLTVDAANEAFYRHFKTVKTETVGHLLWELGQGAWNLPRLRELLEDVLPRKSFFNEFEVVHDFPQLGKRTMLLNARRLAPRPGMAEMILLGIEDVTERQRLDETVRRSEERFRVLTDASAQIVWIAHPDGTLQPDAISWRTFTGQTPEQCLGWGWLDAVHPDDQALARKSWTACVAQQRGCEMEYRLRRSDGAYRWTLVRAAPVLNRDGSLREWIGTNTDITARKQAEEALRERSAEVVAASRAKDEFLAALSHELRTPLNPALLLASAAAVDSSLSAEVRSDFDAIRKNISLEARLIDDLLDLTRISQGKLKIEMQPCDVHEVLRDAVGVVQSDIDEKGLQLSLDLAARHPRVIGDPVRLAQIFWNVLRNAVHFTPPGGEIRVQSSMESSDAQLKVAIADTGMGISADDLERIFERFSQGANNGPETGRRFGGLGLGLAISRVLVTAHGGSIRALSAGPGRGSTFVIDLPVPSARSEATAEIGNGKAPRGWGPAVPPAMIAGTTARSQLSQSTILIVDDHAATRAAIQKVLLRTDAHILVAESVADALHQAQKQKIDFLISDIGLPDGDGHSLIAQLKARQPAIRGIALSGYGMDMDLEKSRQAGFTEHLTKPVSIEPLMQAIHRLVG